MSSVSFQYEKKAHQRISLLIITSKSTEARFFEVFAQVWLVVPSDGGPDVVRRSDWSLGTDAATGCVSGRSVFLLKELGIVVQTAVDFIVHFTSSFLRNNISHQIILNLFTNLKHINVKCNTRLYFQPMKSNKVFMLQ